MSTSRQRARIVLGLAVALLSMPSTSGPDVGSSVMAGQTATLLPDGRWLILGGQAGGRVLARAAVQDPGSGTIVALPNGLQHARAWHTATTLPDGTVLIVGGVDASGRVVETTEQFDPDTLTFQMVTGLAVMPRAYHTATLLTDGRVLIAGGVSNSGALVSQAELWDPWSRTLGQRADGARATLSTPRARHTATLLADGSVLLWGGVNVNGTGLDSGEVFDPQGGRFHPIDVPPPGLDPLVDGPHVAGSLPGDGDRDVPVDVMIAVRFSQPVRVNTLNPSTVLLSSPAGIELITIVPAEGGRLIFITPTVALSSNTVYSLSLVGATDIAGRLVTPTAIHFTTEHGTAIGETPRPPTGPAAPATPPGNDATPGDDDWDSTGALRDGRPNSFWQALPPLTAPSGGTAVAGQVLTLNGQPLSDVTVETEGLDDSRSTTRTDRTGRFLLEGIAAGHREMLVDGRSANRPGRTYGVFELGLEVTGGRTNVLPYTIWMPEIDTAHAVSIPSPTTAETVITTPRIPGLEVRIPAGSVIYDHEYRRVRQLSLTEIPIDRPPFPLPTNVSVPLYFTLQPGAGYVRNLEGAGARLIYPNRRQAPPGTRFDFWHYDPGGKGWHVYGQGTVTPDGRQIEPDPGVAVYEFTGAMVATPSLAPLIGAIVAGLRPGDPVDVATGLFVMEKTDLALADILPIALTRTYRQNDSRSRAFGIGASHPYEIFLVGTAFPYTYIDLILPDGGRVHFPRISPGTSYEDAVYEHTATPTAWYGAKIVWNAPGVNWYLTLRDGTRYTFPESFSATVPARAAVLEVRDRFGNTLQMTRDGTSYDLLKISSLTGRWIDFTYDAVHRVTAATDQMGRTVTYSYDTSGRLTQVIDPAGGVTEYTYDASHRMLTLKDARGITYLTNVYDSNGRVITQTQADGTTYQFAYTVDVNNTVTQTDVTDPRGLVRRVTFNSQGYVLTDTRAVGRPEQQATTYTRQAGTNLVQSVTDALSRQTTFTYDTKGNVTSVTRLAGTPQAVTTSLTWEAPSPTTFNRLTSVTTPLPTTTTWAYDDANRRITITDPLGHQTVVTHNTVGQPVSVANALQQTTTFEYDGQANLAAIVDPLGNRTTRAYDAASRLAQQTDPGGRATGLAYDVLNQLRAIGAPGGVTTRFSYDPNGNLLSVTDARGNSTSYVYNSMDRLTTRTDPLTRSETYAYDNNGNATSFTDRKSQAVSTTYDGLNRPTLVTYQDSSTTSYTWDAGNRVTQIVDSLLGGTITRTYDGLDRLTSETTPEGAISYTYDGAGRRTSLTVAGQPAVTYAYDNADRLTSITQGTAVVTFGYDNADRRTSLTLPNGVTTSYAYDTASRLTGLTYAVGTTTLGTLLYGYDATGNRTGVEGTWARTGLPQPLASATYNAANHQLTFGGQALTYDLNGNLTSDGTSTYTWDARNRLAAINGPAPASFVYDATGRRRAKTISGSTTSFLYDGFNPVQEQAGASIRNLLTGLGVDEFLTRDDGAGARGLLGDALGSTLALVDGSGTIQATYTYDPFGATTVTGPPGANTLSYTGREDDGTGLKYYRARYYHPTLQRFISEDPIGLDGGDINLYAYVANDPLNGTDPTGEFLLAGCASGALTNVAWDLGAYLLVGRKSSLGEVLGNAAVGCISGAVGGPLFQLAGRLVLRVSATRALSLEAGVLARSLGAASRSEELARKLGLNMNSATTQQLLNNLDMPVSEFVGLFRKASILRRLPGEVLEAGVTVEQALHNYGSTVRKLLTAGRFAK